MTSNSIRKWANCSQGWYKSRQELIFEDNQILTKIRTTLKIWIYPKCYKAHKPSWDINSKGQLHSMKPDNLTSS